MYSLSGQIAVRRVPGGECGPGIFVFYDETATVICDTAHDIWEHHALDVGAVAARVAVDNPTPEFASAREEHVNAFGRDSHTRRSEDRIHNATGPLRSARANGPLTGGDNRERDRLHDRNPVAHFGPGPIQVEPIAEGICRDLEIRYQIVCSIDL